MAQRSNQAVAHETAASGGASAEPPAKRPPLGWPAALGLIGAGVVLLAAGLWFLRIPLAEGLIRGELEGRGVDADFEIVNLTLSGASLAAIRLGPEAAPDAAIAAADLRWRWRGLTPEVGAVRLIEPRLSLAIDQNGRISAGALGRLGGNEPSGRRPVLPRIALDIEDGQLLLNAPFGALTAQFEAAGVIGRDFTALAQLAPTDRPGEDYALEQGAAEVRLASAADSLTARLTASADALTWADARLSGLAIDATAEAPLDLASGDVTIAWALDSLRAAGVSADGGAGALRANTAFSADALAFATWRAEADASFARFAAAGDGLNVRGAALTAAASGDGSEGSGEWRLTGDRFAGLGVRSSAPAAAGRFSVAQGQFSADGQITLTAANLDAGARADLAAAFPDLASAPVGPTFAAARAALDRAASRFDATLPFDFSAAGRNARLTVSAPITLAAASGAALTVSPLRDDAPALVLQWPGPSLAGAVAAELSGGGAPRAALLLDTMSWVEGAPLEAEGTLDITDWRAGGASVGAREMVVRAAFAPEGGGRIDLVGPAALSGPLGDGQVRDVAIDLDLAVAWRNGWRVSPNQGCLPVRVGGLDVAGLSFQSGAFRLCAGAGDTLIAADASDRLSGGFAIEALALNGRLAGPDGQPARLGAQRVVGRFAGSTSAIALDLAAGAPSLAVTMAEGRTLRLDGERLTADARFGGAWSIAGTFEAGRLEDPGLPGQVTAIAGRWRAAPEGEAAVVQMEAGEAFVTARTPDDDTLPLFNPVRLTGMTAVLRDGRVTANGSVVLDRDGRAIASFTANHETGTGEGAAQLTADALMFDETLQPHDLSALMRRLVANVEGPATASAEARWSRDRFGVSGTIRPNGLSLSMATIPVIRDVRGEVHFDDLLTLTTPPGQTVTIGELNPGVAISNGRVRFQLLANQQVAIEAAEFDFADGVLSVAPTIITMGAEETHLEVALRDLDAAALIATLNAPDLHATGRIEGAFPVRLTPRTAFIDNGVLHAAPGGGTIAYVGKAGEGVTGPSRVAFDALRSFRYDDLSLTLNGDLSGEVVSEIRFQGENAGQPVDLSPMSGGPIAISARGVPFRFNVSVRAPFRQLARTAASVFDPGQLLDGVTPDPIDDDNSVDVQVEPLR